MRNCQVHLIRPKPRPPQRALSPRRPRHPRPLSPPARRHRHLVHHPPIRPAKQKGALHPPRPRRRPIQPTRPHPTPQPNPRRHRPRPRHPPFLRIRPLDTASPQRRIRRRPKPLPPLGDHPLRHRTPSRLPPSPQRPKSPPPRRPLRNLAPLSKSKSTKPSTTSKSTQLPLPRLHIQRRQTLPRETPAQDFAPIRPKLQAHQNRIAPPLPHHPTTHAAAALHSPRYPCSAHRDDAENRHWPGLRTKHSNPLSPPRPSPSIAHLNRG